MSAVASMPVEVVRVTRKGRYRNAKATKARTLYSLGLCAAEIAEAMQWQRKQVMQVLRRVP